MTWANMLGFGLVTMPTQRGAGLKGTSRTAGFPLSEMIFCALLLTAPVQHDKVAGSHTKEPQGESLATLLKPFLTAWRHKKHTLSTQSLDYLSVLNANWHRRSGQNPISYLLEGVNTSNKKKSVRILDNEHLLYSIWSYVLIRIAITLGEKIG